MNINLFKYMDNNTTKKVIDTTIYSEHWFRCPNQRKGTSINDNTKHIIIKGTMEDFIIYHISEHSININDVQFKNKQHLKINNPLIENLDEDDNEYENNNELKIVKKQSEKNNKKKKNDINNELVVYDKKDPVLSTTISEPVLYKKMFDECYKKNRFEVYEYWVSVGMALKNIFEDEKIAFDLFNYFSSKGKNYE